VNAERRCVEEEIVVEDGEHWLDADRDCLAELWEAFDRLSGASVAVS
jgi:hypothetical protein